MRELMGSPAYEDYKVSMALYLAPNTISNRGRFCCAYCELLFTDQWTLEKVTDACSPKESAPFILVCSIYTAMDTRQSVQRLTKPITKNSLS